MTEYCIYITDGENLDAAIGRGFVENRLWAGDPQKRKSNTHLAGVITLPCSILVTLWQLIFMELYKNSSKETL